MKFHFDILTNSKYILTQNSYSDGCQYIEGCLYIGRYILSKFGQNPENAVFWTKFAMVTVFFGTNQLVLVKVTQGQWYYVNIVKCILVSVSRRDRRSCCICFRFFFIFWFYQKVAFKIIVFYYCGETIYLLV